MVEMVDYLPRRGHRRIGYITGPGRLLLSILRGGDPADEWVEGQIVERQSVATVPPESAPC